MTICWNCKSELPEGMAQCPNCNAAVSRGAVEMMATVRPGVTPRVQIVVGVVVAGRYEIVREIGRGGMGIVYLAFDRMISQEVALKVIPQELCLDPNAVADLKRETAIALKLTHPHIVRLFTLDTWEGQAFVVMEYVAGGTLSHFRARVGGTCSLEEALPLLRQIAAALDYSHNASPPVIHRDLKPLNILLTEGGKVRVADYGLARVLRDSASRVSGHDSAGTLAYMAPEQIRGKGVGRATDIYALAAIIYELLCGHPPFYTGDLRWQILHEEVEPIPGQSAQVNQALQLGLAKEAEQRPGSAAELVAMLAGEEVAFSKMKKNKATPKKPVPPSVKKPTSGRGKLVTALFFVVVLLGASFAGWYSFKPEIKQLLRGGPILTVTTEPAGAMVFVDSEKIGFSPTSVAHLTDGTHTVRLKLERYNIHQEKVVVQDNKPIVIQARLAPEPFGDLSITSEPLGAKILVDGKERGESPLQLNRLDQGNHSIAVQKDGYDLWQKQVEIRPLETAEVVATLVSKFGQLTVTSQPSGAKVFLAGKALGTTPLSPRKIEKGVHLLELQLSKYETWQQNIHIEPLALNKQHAELVFGFGQLAVTSEPPGATIFIDDRQIGVSPFTGEVPKGKHNVLLRLAKYRDWQGEIDVAANNLANLSARLALATGTLRISSEPSGATVKVDGSTIGNSPLSIEKNPGWAKVEVEASGKQSATKQVQIFAGQETPVFVKLEPVKIEPRTSSSTSNKSPYNNSSTSKWNWEKYYKTGSH